MMRSYLLTMGVIALGAVALAGTPTIDGTNDGVGVWGAAVATDAASDGWAGVDATNLYVTYDATYLYLGADCAHASWQNWGFAINTTAGGGNTADPWGRQFNLNFANAADYCVRGEANNAWRELRSWNGSDWNTGSGANLGATESNASQANSFIEVRIPLASLGISSSVGINVAFFVSGDNAGEHGCFDQIPNGSGDTTADNWNESASDNVLNGQSSTLLVPVELDNFQIM